jgi:hypothetical protein
MRWCAVFAHASGSFQAMTSLPDLWYRSARRQRFDGMGEFKMKLQTITAAVLALTIAASPALACKGEEIYADDFSSSDGPWANAPWFSIGGGAAEFKMEAGNSGFIPYLGGNFKEFDVCVDIANPAVKNADAPPVAGLGFWFNDFQNMAAVLLTPGGVMFSIRNSKGRNLLAAPPRKINALKVGNGTTNTLRITVKGQNVTFYANDTRVGAIRGTPEDGLIGLLAESEKDQVTSWKFSNFKLTEAPK